MEIIHVFLCVHILNAQRHDRLASPESQLVLKSWLVLSQALGEISCRQVILKSRSQTV